MRFWHGRESAAAPFLADRSARRPSVSFSGVGLAWTASCDTRARPSALASPTSLHDDDPEFALGAAAAAVPITPATLRPRPRRRRLPPPPASSYTATAQDVVAATVPEGPAAVLRTRPPPLRFAPPRSEGRLTPFWLGFLPLVLRCRVVSTCVVCVQEALMTSALTRTV